MNAPIDIRPASGASEQRAFIRYPWIVHEGHAGWVPPLVSEEKRYFDPRKNHAFSYCDAVMALAYRRHTVCGRIMGIINRRHNTHTGEPVARFGFLECPDDPAIARKLLHFVECWGRSRGMVKIVGPMGFSDQDPEGFRVEGFGHEPTIATYVNFPYMNDLLKACGYTKEVDYVVYKVRVSGRIPDAYERVCERIAREGHVRTYEFRRRSELRPFTGRILALMNETFADLYGYVPLDREEMDTAARRFLPIIDPRFVNFATVDGKDAAFILAMPNIDEGLRKANGRLLPFGFRHVLAAGRRTKQLDLLVGGVKKEFRHHGLAVLGMAMLLRAAQAAGIEVIDSHLELEGNLRMRAEMERMGGILSKRYRIFCKLL
jgi:hypothetical protein